MKVQITTLPARGTLYQAQFKPDAGEPTYATLANTLNQYGPMEEIMEEGTFVSNNRGIVFYLPATDETSNANNNEVYDSFGYTFYDDGSGGLYSDEGFQSVIVSAVNDPPVSLAANATVPSSLGDNTSVPVGVTLYLKSTDVDIDAEESFATRSFARITSFPVGGRLYQYNASNPDKRGTYMDSSVTVVPQTFAWASGVVRYSSQWSVCGEPCMEWANPECTSNDLLAGGRPDGTFS